MSTETYLIFVYNVFHKLLPVIKNLRSSGFQKPRNCWLFLVYLDYWLDLTFDIFVLFCWCYTQNDMLFEIIELWAEQT